MSTQDEFRSERALATGRVSLAIGLLPAVMVQAHDNGPTLVFQLAAAAYLLFAGLLLILLQFTSVRRVSISVAGHLGDSANAIGIMLLAGGGAAVAVASGFCLLGAAYRWGLLATMGTALGLAASQLAQAFVVPILAGADDSMSSIATGSDALVARAAYTLVGGLLLGYLVQNDRQLRTESAIVADVASRLDIRLGLTRTIAVALDALIRLFHARRAVLVVHDLENGRITRWDGARLSPPSSSEAVTVTPLDSNAAQVYLSAASDGGVHAIRRGNRFDAMWADGHSSRHFPAALAEALGPFEQVMALGIEMPRQWTGRVFLMDPRVPRDRSGTVVFAQRLVGRLVPAIYNVYLLRRVRGRSVNEERARMARELHDTVVQSVLGVQVQLHALASRTHAGRPELAAELARLGLTLREEVLRLREVMQQMKSVTPTPEQLTEVLAALVQRFETETGIRTRFITRADQVPLPPRACLEVMRIVQEALVNVRRHSGAANVFIRFGVDDDVCRLSVDDDGRGFPFSGRLSLPELDRQQQGPWSIKDRVRRLGGDIAVESAPERGSRLEISFPVRIYALQ